MENVSSSKTSITIFFSSFFIKCKQQCTADYRETMLYALLRNPQLKDILHCTALPTTTENLLKLNVFNCFVGHCHFVVCDFPVLSYTYFPYTVPLISASLHTHPLLTSSLSLSSIPHSAYNTLSSHRFSGPSCRSVRGGTRITEAGD